MTDETPDYRDGICAYLMGGLGNQLFILAAAWAQARRLDVPLYIDASRFVAPDPLERPETPRSFALDRYRLPGRVIVEESPWRGNSPRRPPIIRRPGSRSSRLSVHRQRGDGFDPELERIRPGTTILGYFQSPRHFEAIEDEVYHLVSTPRLDPGERSAIDALAASERATLHVRRGDYLNASTRAHHGIAGAGYFVAAVDLLTAIGAWTGGRVYSDSPEAAAAELASLEDLVMADAATPMSDTATLVAMSSANAFIMSNSSFSWWAAWMMHRRTGAPVIAPRPWLANGFDASQLLLPQWPSIGDRS